VLASSGLRSGTLSRKTRYDAQASGFADSLSHLLNNTVTTGILVTSVLSEDSEDGWVGYGIGPQDYVGGLIPIKPGKGPASCWFQIGLTLMLDPEVHQLIVQGSTMGLYCHDDPESMIFHYDFNREPDNDYPEAHLQVSGSSDSLNELCDRHDLERSLERFHFPVGGKRYRPIVEDLVEFVIAERVAQPHEGWEAIVRGHRNDWERVQLKSVVRRDPDTAAEELRRQGYEVKPPAG
jgi:hypothetical protein